MSTVVDILDERAMLAPAQAETGLHDWGDDTLPERFGVWIEKRG